MRYLTLAEALVIGEIVIGIPSQTLARVSRIELLGPALHAPQAEFEGVELYPDFVTKAHSNGVGEAFRRWATRQAALVKTFSIL